MLHSIYTQRQQHYNRWIIVYPLMWEGWAFWCSKKNTYRRVYTDDGTYSYPRLEQNISRRQGELYFETLEITCSKEGSVSKPIYSLLNFFLDIEIPKLEELTKEITAWYGHRAVVRYQMDNVGPHVEEQFSMRLGEEFHQRGWMLVPQPPNSPITNKKDAAIFNSLFILRVV